MHRQSHFVFGVLFSTLAVFAGCALEEPAAEGGDLGKADSTDGNSDVEVLEVFDTTELNAGLDPYLPTVDLAFYMTEGAGVTWERMSDSVVGARAIFAEAGVQVRVSSAMHIDVPEDWQRLEPSVLDRPTNVEWRESDLYRHQDDVNRRLAPRTQSIFEAVLANYPEEETGIPAHRVLHIVTIDRVPIAFWEWDGDEWELKSVGTGGLSFPPYMFAERMPLDMRGVITMSGSGSKTLAHEMGHNLINVSHEGVGQCPTFATQGDDLMLYGTGSRIPSGLEGRWQLERLHMSPFIYTRPDGEVIFENEFLDGGRYYDPMYGSYMIDPVCGEAPESE